MIQVLLLTGANNHDWERSAPFCKKLLEKSGRFQVTLTKDPSAALADRAKLDDYDLFFVDYNGPAWSGEAKANFIDAVLKGVGVCILHAANNAFRGWVEYEKLCALLWRDGTSHGTYHRFDVVITDRKHPITQGLAPVMKDHPDELYHKMVHMHNAPYHVLATAYSSPAERGTGEDEPVLIVRDFGRGRVFHNILGHVWKGSVMDTFESPEFQRVTLRGCEWAAGEEVTL
jgi:uncharacterized protein